MKTYTEIFKELYDEFKKNFNFEENVVYKLMDIAKEMYFRQYDKQLEDNEKLKNRIFNEFRKLIDSKDVCGYVEDYATKKWYEEIDTIEKDI